MPPHTALSNFSGVEFLPAQPMAGLLVRQDALRHSGYYHRVHPTSFVVIGHHKVSGSTILRTYWP